MRSTRWLSTPASVGPITYSTCSGAGVVAAIAMHPLLASLHYQIPLAVCMTATLLLGLVVLLGNFEPIAESDRIPLPPLLMGSLRAPFVTQRKDPLHHPTEPRPFSHPELAMHFSVISDVRWPDSKDPFSIFVSPLFVILSAAKNPGSFTVTVCVNSRGSPIPRLPP